MSTRLTAHSGDDKQPGLASRFRGALALSLILVLTLGLTAVPARAALSNSPVAPAPVHQTGTMPDMPGMSPAPPFGGRMTMTEGNMQMEMLSPSGKPPTWEEVARAYRLVRATKLAAQKYRNLQTALRDGYITAPALFVKSQGYHYIKLSDIPRTAAQFDPRKPAVLVYTRVRGAMKLSGAMYYVPQSTTPSQLARILPASMAGWHRHVNTCATLQQILPYHDAASCRAHGGTFLASTGWMVHVWIWESHVGLFDMDR